MQRDSSEALKVNRSRLYTLWFGWYSRRQFRRFFNSVRVFMNPQTPLMERGVPVVFYANHAYWWDGFWSQLCTENFFHQNLFIAIEEPQLRKHRFFTRIGAFSILRSNARSAVRSLEYAAELLLQPSIRQNALWIFPQGEIHHVDRRPLGFFGGTASIVSRVLARSPAIYLVSVVSRIEYLDDQRPELFLSFQAPVKIMPDTCPGKDSLSEIMEKTAESHLDELKEMVVSRQLGNAETLVTGVPSINRRVEAIRSRMLFWRRPK